MKELIPKDEYGVFANTHDVAMADSLFVAQVFDKRHDAVLRDIRQLDCSADFRLHNFVESSYRNAQGKKMPCCNMTRDGLVFLIMGYRGKKAAQFKELYIRRFNEMDKFIKTLVSARHDFPLLTENIKLLHEHPKPYHFSNECDMLNRVVTGMSAKQFKAANSLPKETKSIRPFLTDEQIRLIDVLQRIDVGLMVAVPDFQQRKRHLEWYKSKVQEGEVKLCSM